MDGMPRGRKPKHKTAEQELRSLIKWAEQQGFMNVAEAPHRALAGVEARGSL